MPTPSILWGPAGPPRRTDDPHAGAPTLQDGRDAAQRGRRPDGVDEGVDVAARLLEELLGERDVPGDRVGVLELVREEGPRLPGDLAGGRDHVLDQLLRRQAPFARDERQLGAERGHVVPLLAAEGVGRDDPDPVALRGGDERERGPGAPAGVLDDGAAGPEPAVGLGARDHGERHPVLHAPGRVLPLELDEDVRRARGDDLAKADEGRAADGVEDVHARGLPPLEDSPARGRKRFEGTEAARPTAQREADSSQISFSFASAFGHASSRNASKSGGVSSSAVTSVAPPTSTSV